MSVGIRPSYSLTWMISCCIIRHDNRSTTALKTLEFTYMATATQINTKAKFIIKVWKALQSHNLRLLNTGHENTSIIYLNFSFINKWPFSSFIGLCIAQLIQLNSPELLCLNKICDAEVRHFIFERWEPTMELNKKISGWVFSSAQFLLFLKYFIYLFLWRGEGKGKER